MYTLSSDSSSEWRQNTVRLQRRYLNQSSSVVAKLQEVRLHIPAAMMVVEQRQ